MLVGVALAGASYSDARANPLPTAKPSVHGVNLVQACNLYQPPRKAVFVCPMSGVCRIEDPRGKEGRRDLLRVVSPRRSRWRVARGNFTPGRLPEPCVNLSTHTAPDVQPLVHTSNGLASSQGSSCRQLALSLG